MKTADISDLAVCQAYEEWKTKSNAAFDRQRAKINAGAIPETDTPMADGVLQRMFPDAHPKVNIPCHGARRSPRTGGLRCVAALGLAYR